jgi:hypothetical protein
MGNGGKCGEMLGSGGGIGWSEGIHHIPSHPQLGRGWKYHRSKRGLSEVFSFLIGSYGDALIAVRGMIKEVGGKNRGNFRVLWWRYQNYFFLLFFKPKIWSVIYWCIVSVLRFICTCIPFSRGSCTPFFYVFILTFPCTLYSLFAVYLVLRFYCVPIL